MAKDKLTEYSATNASNDVIGDISVAEGMLPSAVNNALREQMTHLKNFSDGTDAIDALAVDNLKLDGNTISSTDTNGNVTIDPAGTGNTIVASGKVGISTASPDSESLVDLGSGENSGHTRKLNIVNTGNSRAGLGALSNIFRMYYADDQSIQYGTVSRDGNFTFSEKMRLDPSGKVRIGNSSGVYTEQFLVQSDTSSVNPMTVNNTRSSAATDYAIIFGRNGSIVGSIQTSLSATSFLTSSDYRLKENVTYDWDATTRLKQLKPARFNFIADADTTVDGFLADEAQAVVPEAVTGTKDAMRDEEYEITPAVLDDNGNEVTPAEMGTRSVPDYQGIDQAKLVPLLTKALIESVEKIEQLEARITALEA